MRDLLIIAGVLALALIVGLVLFFYDPSPAAAPSSGAATPSAASYDSYGASSPVPFSVLAHGMGGPQGIGEVNYRITTSDQLAALWQMVYGDNAAQPSIDFSRQEVLAFFDGTHATGGYDVAVTSVSDGSSRTVNIEHRAPGAKCIASQAQSAPFEMIAVAKTGLSITHIDSAVTQDCR